MKAYISKHASRPIPVGYSAADVRSILMDQANYFQCALQDSDSRADFFGLNSYSWCGDSDFHASGYDVLTDNFANSSMPVIFSEYGCNAVQPRKFLEVQALYGEEMTKAFAGGLVYEFAQEANDYGLVKVDEKGDAELLEDFDHLREQYGKLDMKQLKKASKAHTDAEPVECSADLITGGSFLDSFDLPERPHSVQTMIEHGCGYVKAGKIVDVGEKSVSQKIHGPNGEEVSGVKLNVVKDDKNENGDTKNKSDANASANDNENKTDDDNNTHAANEDSSDSTTTATSTQSTSSTETPESQSTATPTTVSSTKQTTNAASTPTSSANAIHGSNASSSSSSVVFASGSASGSASPSTSSTPAYYTGAAGKASSSSSMVLGLLSGAAVLGLIM